MPGVTRQVQELHLIVGGSARGQWCTSDGAATVVATACVEAVEETNGEDPRRATSGDLPGDRYREKHLSF